MMRKIFISLTCTILLAGCAAATQQPVTKITVEASDFTYDPVSISVPAGQPVTVILKNIGKVEHDFVIDKINITNVEASESAPAQHHQMDQHEYDLHFFAKAGETATMQFTAMEPGTYEIFCTIDGHREAGMIGELVVTAQ